MTRTTVALLILLLVPGFGPAPRAEVALSEAGPGGETASLYVLGAIIDETDPVGSVWRRYHMSDSHKVLNEEGEANGDGPPSLLIHPVTGLPTVVWSRNSPAGYDVVISHFTGGSWSEPVALTDSPADELDPVLLVDPGDGSVHVVYWVHDAAPRILHRSAPADLSAWSPPVQLSPPGQIAARPGAIFDGGRLTVAYEVHEFGFGTTPRQIVVAAVEEGQVTSEVIAVTDRTGACWPRLHSREGRFWLDWIDLDGEMAWTRRQPAGGWEPVRLEIYTDLEDLHYHVRGRIRARALD